MYYNKDELKQSLEPEQIYDLLTEWGGEPTWNAGHIVSDTICHNLPGQGSHKLYYYFESKLFVCYTGCQETSFDVFQLTIKIMKIQKDINFELYDAMHFIASYFGIEGAESPSQQEDNKLEDWKIFQQYKNLTEKLNKPLGQKLRLKEYNPIILTRFSYLPISPWEKEGISREVCKRNMIGYYAGMEQITIPHFDIDGRFIGLRGRFLAEDDAERYGKYKPLIVNRIIYSHPLSVNLYNLNNSKDNISRARAAIIFESEKSSLLYQTYYGYNNDISIACCGSSISSIQIELLRNLGVQEIVIALDRQFQEINDEEFKLLTNRLIAMYKRYSQYVKISCIFDKDMITKYKASPIDEGKEKFEYLLKNRIVPR